MISHWFLFLLLSLIAIDDLRRREVSTAALSVTALWGIIATAMGWSGQTWMESLGGVSVGFLLSMPLFCIGGIGGGDVKLLSVMGLLLGWQAELGVLFYTAVFGGLGASVARWRKREDYAYGPAIALGLLAYLVRGHFSRGY
jgi:Flp pilus assembly protein protease CpaA